MPSVHMPWTLHRNAVSCLRITLATFVIFACICLVSTLLALKAYDATIQYTVRSNRIFLELDTFVERIHFMFLSELYTPMPSSAASSQQKLVPLAQSFYKSLHELIAISSTMPYNDVTELEEITPAFQSYFLFIRGIFERPNPAEYYRKEQIFNYIRAQKDALEAQIKTIATHISHQLETQRLQSRAQVQTSGIGLGLSCIFITAISVLLNILIRKQLQAQHTHLITELSRMVSAPAFTEPTESVLCGDPCPSVTQEYPRLTDSICDAICRKETLHQIYTFSDIGLWRIDPEGRTLALSSYLARMLGYETSEQGQKCIPDHLIERFTDPTTIRHAIESARTNGVAFLPDASLRCRHGSIVRVKLQIIAVHCANGSSQAFELIVSDKTQELLVQALQSQRDASQKNDETRRALLNAVLNTLSMPIFQFTKLIAKCNAIPSEPIRKYKAVQLDQASKSLQRTMFALHAFIGTPCANIVGNISTIRPEEFIQTVTAEAATISGSKCLSLHTSLSPDTPETIQTNAEHLQFILEQLVDNAIRYTERGSVHVIARPDGEEHIVFEVSDTGSGIHVNDSVLFSAYAHRSSFPKQQTHGAGLGLAISRYLASIMGGQLSRHSTSEPGSCFQLRLPVMPPSVPTRHVSSLHDQSDIGCLETPRPVLIAEDDMMTQHALHAIFEQTALAITFVSDGKEALVALESGVFEIAVLNLEMPELDGIAVVKAFRQAEGKTAVDALPIFITSAHVQEEFRQRSIQAGANGYLTKPFSPMELIKTISQSLTRSQNREPSPHTN
ncbi:hybrid sensor histidine kinase/response regulator [Desulfovibrio inopinatus]|uniref:hybrid sensor histidine kinase/response regulator n=1 Tax=Desulfovibrio inopinatus TaxID=102109 RepID=UPI0003FA5839|nr:hybrid sensor histidine kinase/response regulator [Desulfovibrio inopinatus]